MEGWLILLIIWGVIVELLTIGVFAWMGTADYQAREEIKEEEKRKKVERIKKELRDKNQHLAQKVLA